MKRINIMTSCDDNLAKYILPQIASIAHNLSKYRVEFYLFHSRIAPGSIEAISSYCGAATNIAFHEIVVTDTAPYARLAKLGGSDWAYEAADCKFNCPSKINQLRYAAI